MTQTSKILWNGVEVEPFWKQWFCRRLFATLSFPYLAFRAYFVIHPKCRPIRRKSSNFTKNVIFGRANSTISSGNEEISEEKRREWKSSSPQETKLSFPLLSYFFHFFIQLERRRMRRLGISRFSFDSADSTKKIFLLYRQFGLFDLPKQQQQQQQHKTKPFRPSWPLVLSICIHKELGYYA